MANITDKVAQIRQATYGKDVRESIASGIEAINTEVVSTTGRQNLIDAQEQTRIDAENIRKTNEGTRIVNEDFRISHENSRQTAEATRQSTFDTNENIRVQDNITRTTEFNALKTEINTSINNADTATTNTNTAISNYQTVVEQTRKIYKPSIAIYSDFATTYPNPEIGWTVVSRDNNIEYRWDGIEWMPIGTGDSSVGLNVFVGSSAPVNPNTIWLDAPEDTRYAKIVPSVTEPIEVGQIWWELDD